MATIPVRNRRRTKSSSAPAGPEGERYRIPESLRRTGQRREGAWTSHAMELEEVQRDTRPDSCSVVGSWGQSGCTQQMIRQWRAERRAREREER